MIPVFFLTSFTRQLHELDPTYKVTTYKTTTSNTGPRHHVYNHHTLIYLEEAGRQGWPIQIKPLNALLDEGWTVTAIRERLRDPTRTIDSLGDVPSHSDALLRTGQPGTLEDEIPNFTLDEMHRQLVRFVVADNQVSRCLISMRYY